MAEAKIRGFTQIKSVYNHSHEKLKDKKEKNIKDLNAAFQHEYVYAPVGEDLSEHTLAIELAFKHIQHQMSFGNVPNYFIVTRPIDTSQLNTDYGRNLFAKIINGEMTATHEVTDGMKSSPQNATPVKNLIEEICTHNDSFNDIDVISLFCNFFISYTRFTNSAKKFFSVTKESNWWNNKARDHHILEENKKTQIAHLESSNRSNWTETNKPSNVLQELGDNSANPNKSRRTKRINKITSKPINNPHQYPPENHKSTVKRHIPFNPYSQNIRHDGEKIPTTKTTTRLHNSKETSSENSFENVRQINLNSELSELMEKELEDIISRNTIKSPSEDSIFPNLIEHAEQERAKKLIKNLDDHLDSNYSPIAQKRAMFTSPIAAFAPTEQIPLYTEPKVIKSTALNKVMAALAMSEDLEISAPVEAPKESSLGISINKTSSVISSAPNIFIPSPISQPVEFKESLKSAPEEGNNIKKAKKIKNKKKPRLADFVSLEQKWDIVGERSELKLKEELKIKEEKFKKAEQYIIQEGSF